MAGEPSSTRLRDLASFPLLDALYGRRSRRFGLGMTIPGGPLAYRIGDVDNADRRDYLETRVYFPPGAEAIAGRLAQELGVAITALPGGKDDRRLVVIVGADRAG